MSIKPLVLILVDHAGRNPVVRMYVNALQDEYRIVIGCHDAKSAKQIMPDVEFISFPVFRGWSVYNFFIRIQDFLKINKNIDFVYLGWSVFNSLRIAIALLRRQKPESIIAVDGDTLLPARILTGFWYIPYQYCVCELWPYQFKEWSVQRSRSMAMIEKWGMLGSSNNIVPSSILIRQYVRRYGVSALRFSILNTCPSIPAKCARNVLRLPLKIYYHGGYMADRGLENLLDAMQTVTGAHLYLRGFGVLESILRDLVIHYKLSEKVTFLDPIPSSELAEAATEFDVGIIIASPVTTNGRYVIGYKLFENMAAGLAIAGSRSRLLGPFLAQYPVGITFEGCQTASIVAALQYCVDHPEKVLAWKKQARALAEREFNDQVQGKKLRQMIAEIVSNPRAKPI